jgi:DNA-binding CsgD family transcriptional regulator
MGTLVGRDREVATLHAFLDGDEGRILLLEGEAGIGKTTLWRRGVEAASERGYTVLAATAAAAETQLSFTVLRDLFEPVFDEVETRLPEPQRQALAVTLLREEPPARALDPAAIDVASTHALRLLSADRKLLLAVDDVQWLDPASSAVLAYALRRVDDGAFKALLAQRPESAGVVARDGTEVIELGALSVGALGRVLHDQLGVAYPRPTLHRLAGTSGGNPLFTLELARAHDDSLAPGTPLSMPATLHELVTDRIAALPRDTFELLVYAAAAARPVSSEPLYEPALAARLVVAHEGEINFVHPLFGAGAYSLADAALRRDVHRRLANEATDLEERARHLALATNAPAEEVAATLESAATKMRVRGDRVVAAELFQDAARLTPDGDDAGRARRLLAGGGALFEAGDSDRARMLFERVLTDGANGDVAAEARWRLGTVLAETGSHDGPMELWDEAVASAVDPQLAADIHRSMAVASIYAGDGDGAVSHAKSALAAAESSSDPEALAFALAARAYAAAVVGDSSYRAFVERSLEVAAPLEIASSAWTPAAVAAECALLALDVEAAELGMSAVLDDAVETGNAEMELWAAHRMAAGRLLAGKVAAAGKLVPVIVELAETTGVMQLPAARLAAEVAAHSADVDAPRARLRELTAESERQGWARHLWAARVALGAVHLACSEWGEAAAELESARGIAAACGIRSITAVVPLADEAEAAANAGQLDHARAALAAAQGVSDLPAVVEPLLLRAEAAVCAAAGDLRKAEKLLERAAEHDEAETLPLQQGRSLLMLGSVQRRLRQRRAARETLQRAQALFTELGSELWAQRAREEIGRIGGRAPSEHALTPSEERIAALVAEGKKNKEVADTLVISVHTVEAALTRIYQKLDVRSRTELARRLSKH